MLSGLDRPVRTFPHGFVCPEIGHTSAILTFILCVLKPFGFGISIFRNSRNRPSRFVWKRLPQNMLSHCWFWSFFYPIETAILPALSSDDLKLDIVGSCIINSRHSNPYPYTVNLPWNILSTDQRATCRVAQVGANLHLFPDTVWRSHPKISYCMEIKKRTEIEQKNICFCLPPDYLFSNVDVVLVLNQPV